MIRPLSHRSFFLNRNRIGSIVIGCHLACVAIGLFSNQIRSDLFTQLNRLIAVYAGPLNLAPAYPVPFHVSHAVSQDDDHYFEIDIPGEAPARLADIVSASTGGNARWQRGRCLHLARSAALATSSEDDSALASYALAIGTYVLRDKSVDRLIVRLMAFQPPHFEDENASVRRSDRQSDEWYTAVYEADIWRDANSRIHAHKRVPIQEAAPPVSEVEGDD
jgi:hypothetical protein